MNIYTILPSTFLFYLAVITLCTAIKFIQIYNNTGEPVFIHGGAIFIFLFLAFLSGSIGVLFQLDQQENPIFDFNLFSISMTYIELGFIYHSLRQGSNIKHDYLIFLLSFAPFYAIGLMIGLEFSIVPAVLSQIIPLVIVIYIDRSILTRVIALSLNKKNEQYLIEFLKRIFQTALFIHIIGMITMGVFSLLFIIGYEYQLEQIWGAKWSTFDYGYFIALLLLAMFFTRIFYYIKKMGIKIIKLDTSEIFNSILE